MWTPVLISKKVMKTKDRTGYGHELILISPSDEIWSWLKDHVNELQESSISKCEWWWDLSDNPDLVKFCFRDPAVAILFKLAWGGDVV